MKKRVSLPDYLKFERIFFFVWMMLMFGMEDNILITTQQIPPERKEIITYVNSSNFSGKFSRKV